VGHGIPRASAALILNDLNTGYPVACLESSIISAARTAGSAALAAKAIGASRPRPTRLGLIGTGLIARYVHTYLTAAGFRFDRIAVHDLNPAHAAAFLGYLHGTGTSAAAEIEVQAEDLIRTSDLVVFATTAGTPHVTDAGWFAHHPLVLHLSLRDLAPQVILESVNVVDDVDHCLQANTSVHLVAQQTGSRAHIDATLYEVLTGAVQPPADRTVVFSPFGLGVLDLVVANHVHRTALSAGDATVVGDFFHERHRYDIPATAISAESPA
jgi:ornithine cyclodeaminase